MKFITGKEILCTLAGILGGLITTAFGGWSEGLTTLLLLMAVDFVSGLVVAGLFQASPKTDHGGLESMAGWKGLARKVGTLLMVMVSYRIDLALGTDYLMTAVVIGFIVNEVISLVENMGLMGIPMPKAITKMIDILSAKANATQEEKDNDKAED